MYIYIYITLVPGFIPLFFALEVKALHDFQKNVAIIQQDAASWLHTVVPHMFPISSVNYQQRWITMLMLIRSYVHTLIRRWWYVDVDDVNDDDVQVVVEVMMICWCWWWWYNDVDNDLLIMICWCWWWWCWCCWCWWWW